VPSNRVPRTASWWVRPPTYVRQKFESTAPIEIDVRTLYALPQTGCSRLEVTTRQKDVLEKAQRGDKELVYQVSYCRDARFPEKR
jgi:hypothetical protein